MNNSFRVKFVERNCSFSYLVNYKLLVLFFDNFTTYCGLYELNQLGELTLTRINFEHLIALDNPFIEVEGRPLKNKNN